MYYLSHLKHKEGSDALQNIKCFIAQNFETTKSNDQQWFIFCEDLVSTDINVTKGDINIGLQRNRTQMPGLSEDQYAPFLLGNYSSTL
jgi:hypothetical protein